jgi:DNA-binding LacI/PurR family transcriptional regulator
MELAALCNVSRGTIRVAIDKVIESGELSRRRFARPIVVGFSTPKQESRPTEIHVWLHHPTADMISLLTLKGVSLGLRGSRYRMVVKEPSRMVGRVIKEEERQFFAELLTNENVAGAIIERDPFANDSDLIAALVTLGKPLVFIDCVAPDGIPTDHVGTANRAAARACVEHLLDHGHTNIACISDCDIPTTLQDRIEGYSRAMQQASGQVTETCLVCSSLPESDGSLEKLAGVYALTIKRNPHYHELAERAVSAVLAMNPRPTALFVTCDMMAYWVCALLEGAGVRIPEQMSVVGFDWIAGRNNSPVDELTSANQDFEGFGRHAAELLLDRLSGRDSGPPKHVLLNAPLVIRSSTTHNFLITSTPRVDVETRNDAPSYAHEK